MHAPATFCIAGTSCPSDDNLYSSPFCSRSAPVYGALQSTCKDSDCGLWGVRKAYDGLDKGVSTLEIAVTDAELVPYMQLDLGAVRTDIDAVRIVSSNDPTFPFTLSNNLEVYLSNTPNATDAPLSGTKCGSAITFSALNEAASVACPSSASGRYLTVIRAGLTSAAAMAISEISALVAGAARHG